MSNNQFISFIDEMQQKFTCTFKAFNPLGFATAMLLFVLKPKIVHQPCRLCGCPITYYHGRRVRRIHGGTALGVPIFLEMDQVRRKCKRCRKTFVQIYEHLPSGRSMTTETENYILWFLGSTPMILIAKSIGVSVQTIANRAIKFGESEMKTMLEGHYKYLSMDEVFIGRDKEDNKHVIYWVLNDISTPWKANNIILDIGRTKDNVSKHLMSLKHRDKVEAVCIDMWEGYKEAVVSALPNADIVVDRFHVVQLAEKRMNNVRKQSKVPREVKADIKKDAELFLKSFYLLDYAELERLENYLKMDPELENMYYILQDLLEFYNIRGYDAALEYLCQWESRVIKFGVNEALLLYETIYEWLPYIMNYFTYRITNGKTEGKNNLIRQIDRMGFHYGLSCMRGCLYAHDRRQEYEKWKRYQKRVEKAKGKPRKIRIRKAGSLSNESVEPAA